jgi:hypothetical protein
MSSSVLCRILSLLVSSVPEVGSGRTVWRSPTSSARLLRYYCALKVRLYALPRNRRDSACNALLLQSYSLLWKHVPTIRLPCCHENVVSEALPSRWADCSFQASCNNILFRDSGDPDSAGVWVHVLLAAGFYIQSMCTKRTSVLFGEPHERVKRVASDSQATVWPHQKNSNNPVVTTF